MPQELVQAGWEFGLLTAGIPEKFGGFDDYSLLTSVLAMEEFAYGDLALAFNLTVPGLFAVPIMLSGTEAQKERFLPKFCSSSIPRVTAALTEPNIRFDPRNLATKAVRKNEHFELTGLKSFVPIADRAEDFLVYASLDGETQAFIVSSSNPGLRVERQEKLMGIKALPTFRVSLVDCRVPLTSRLGGDEGIDFNLILNHCRAATSAAAVGVARAAYEYACEYAKNRVQFGEPIAHRQSIAFMLAEMAIDVDAARLLVWETAWKLEHGKEATKNVALMKYFVDKAVMQTADRAVQILGGYGYIREFPAELWLRNARGFAAFDGLAIV